MSRTLPDTRGPRFSNADFSVFKILPISEALRLQFRAEMFNATNSPMFGLPNGAFGSANFVLFHRPIDFDSEVAIPLKPYHFGSAL